MRPARDGGDLLVVRDLDAPDPAAASRAAGFDVAEIRWLQWASEERLLVGVSARVDVRVGGTRHVVEVPMTRVLSIRREALTQPVVLMQEESRRMAGAIYNLRLATVTDFLPNDPDHVLMPARRGRMLHLFRVNLATGASELVERGSALTLGWHADASGRPVMRVDRSDSGRRVFVYLREGATDRWRRVSDFRINELSNAAQQFTWAGQSGDSGQVYVQTRPQGADRSGIYLYDINQGQILRQAAEHPQVDISRPLIDSHTGRYAGYFFIDDRLRFHYLNPALRAHYEGLEEFFAGEASVVPVAARGARMLVYVSGPQEPGVYYLYDMAAGSIEPLLNSMPALQPERLAPVRIVRYPARDGLQITGYLTEPPGGAGPHTPLVVMPHGGPESRDMYDFDPLAQVIASRGYAVFQPNFRGSSGYGRAFATAGFRQWGGAMQNDVTDGVQWLAAQGLADPQRVCIAGLSYGGYSALAGAALTPDLYRCAVAGAAVTNLTAFIDYWRERDGDAHYYWVESMGDPRSDRAAMDAASPVHLADRIRIPVLLFHGARDETVPVAQSREMVLALARAGVAHQYREYPGLRHQFHGRVEQMDVAQRMLALFDNTIGPRAGATDPFALSGPAVELPPPAADDEDYPETGLDAEEEEDGG
ncbi:MAG: S9 family peptidase [Maricaulaceae bacterium]|nr:S9 family peptidase [Maricaulaceae bacterium]